jgi:hypothetical protein
VRVDPLAADMLRVRELRVIEIDAAAGVAPAGRADVMSRSRMLWCSLIVSFACVSAASVQRGNSRPVWFEGTWLIPGDGSGPIENSAWSIRNSRVFTSA